MSPYIMMLIVMRIGQAIKTAAITLDVNKIPQEVNINDTESKSVTDYLRAFLPNEFNVEGALVQSIEKVDFTAEPHYVAEDLPDPEPVAESESGTEGISDIQRNDFEGRISNLKDASDKTKSYAKGCINSKGVCQPERVIEHLTI